MQAAGHVREARVQAAEAAREIKTLIEASVERVAGGARLVGEAGETAEAAAVREEAGADVPIVLDSGILTGEDIVAALALGADFTLIGRAYLYGLMAGGQEGVRRVIELLAVAMAAALCAAALPVARLARMQPATLIRTFVNER